MRRKILKNKQIIICLILVAIFTGLSFLFDQRVVQQENEVRKISSKLSSSKIILNENLFLLNSLFNISKEMGVSFRMKIDTLDETASNRSLFDDPLEWGENYNLALISGTEGYEKIKNILNGIYINVLKNNNKNVDLVKTYLGIFKQNDVFIKIISRASSESGKEYNFDLLLENIDKYYFTEEDINKIPFKKSLEHSSLVSNEDQLYNLYSEHRDRIVLFHDLGYEMKELTKLLIKEQFKNYNLYEQSLSQYLLVKNKKNLYILISILFQILGLTFLMVLFKVIIIQEKK
jgi:hypothetical protein